MSLGILVLTMIAIGVVVTLTLAFRHGRRRIAVSEQRFHDLAVTGSDWLWETGADLRYTFLDERFSEITGVTAETRLGKTPDELYATGAFRVDPDAWA